ncbi:N-acetylneuraminate epimerase [bacterium BMS3Abin03]|nr:N-acetylneuraminate epimerase [bacterium BMS3Abin03]
MNSLTKTLIIFALLSVSIHAQQYGHWEIIDSTNLPRYEHASVVMANGNVMVTGGVTGYTTSYSSSAEIYDVVSNTWNFIDSMHYARGNHKMALLNDGRIIVIGGFNQNSCEIYDPTSETWEFTDSLNLQRDYRFTATTLTNGTILVIGGVNFETNPPRMYNLKSCELFDPVTEKWSVVDSLEIERQGHTATVMPDGRVLVAGGLNSSGSIKQCEIFDPETGVWSMTDSLNIERDGHSAVLLPNGKVLVSGGSSTALYSCEIFDPITENWEVVGSTAFAHVSHSSIVLSDSLIMLVGGAAPPPSWELYNSKTFSSVFLAALPVEKFESTVHLLPDGRVINIGGEEIDGMVYFATDICLMYYPNATGIAYQQDKLTAFSLGQNHPNPFNPTTVIEYSIPTKSFVELKIYDILGNEIATLVSEEKTAGKHSVKFNAGGLPSGIYLYRLTSNKFTETKKLIFLK